MVLDGQRMGDERDWVLVGFFVTCSSSAEKRFIRPAKQDEMGLCELCQNSRLYVALESDRIHERSDEPYSPFSPISNW